ncbi:SHOCT domain-containing protein [Saccharopolyspora pogona]|uniref:SHOCT domain-containing protein n=1 Tax=Saccharopolyspora pogona TaxID=333966 RepID=UPI00168739B2|nr:SHOCT domain-containing protein [Saccharopolyspora pogona]
MPYWDGHGMGAWGFVVTTVSMVLLWVLIIAAIVAVVRYLGRTGRVERGTGRAEEILAERFARGDIDEEEYRRRLQALSEHDRRRA